MCVREGLSGNEHTHSHVHTVQNLCQPIETAVVGQSPEHQINLREGEGKRDEEEEKEEDKLKRGAERENEDRGVERE